MAFEDSLDPRMRRIGLPGDPKSFEQPDSLDQFETYEVFHQEKRGAQHVHVGIVHAPSDEMALLFAKEQYARRFPCVNIWVVPTQYVTRTETHEADMFAHNSGLDKSYRDAASYRNRDKIDEFISRSDMTDQSNRPTVGSEQKALSESAAGPQQNGDSSDSPGMKEVVVTLPSTVKSPFGERKTKAPKIILTQRS